MAKEKEKAGSGQMLFGKINYLLLLGGLVIIILGLILMSGGQPEDPDVFNPEVFSFRRITLAPLIMLAGFAVVTVGILKKPKEATGSKGAKD